MTISEQGQAILQFDKPDNLVELLEDTIAKFPDNAVIGEKDEQGIFQWITYREFGKRVDHLRGGLASLGVGKDNSVGIIANNRVEWGMAAFATYGLGARWIPMYPVELESVWKYIIVDSAIKVLFVTNNEIHEKVKNWVDEISTLEKIIIIESDADNSMRALEKTGEQSPVASLKPSPEQDAALIYTSGTTGDPKGVLLSHGNFTSNAQAGYRAYPELNENSLALSILPWAHSYAQTAELYNFLQFGGAIAITSVDTMAEDLKKANPTHLMCVPRLFHRIYDGIYAKMAEEGGMKEKVVVPKSSYSMLVPS